MKLSLLHEANIRTPDPTLDEGFWGTLGKIAGGFVLDMGKEAGLQAIEAILQSGGLHGNLRGKPMKPGYWRKGKYYKPRDPNKPKKKKKRGITGLPDAGDKVDKTDLKGGGYMTL